MERGKQNWVNGWQRYVNNAKRLNQIGSRVNFIVYIKYFNGNSIILIKQLTRGSSWTSLYGNALHPKTRIGKSINK